jgi:hypothetical protein
LIISLILNFGAAVGQSCSGYILIGSYHCNYGSRAVGFQTGYSTDVADPGGVEKCYQKCINQAVGNLGVTSFDWDGDGEPDIANSFHWKSGRCYCNLNECGFNFQSGSSSYKAYSINNTCVATTNSAFKFKVMEKVFDYPNPITDAHWNYENTYLWNWDSPTVNPHASAYFITENMCKGLSHCMGLEQRGSEKSFINISNFEVPKKIVNPGVQLSEKRDVWMKSTCDDDDRLFEWDRTYTVPEPTIMPTENIFECVCQPRKYDESGACTSCASNTYKDEAGNEACKHVHLDIFKIKPAKSSAKYALKTLYHHIVLTVHKVNIIQSMAVKIVPMVGIRMEQVKPSARCAMQALPQAMIKQPVIIVWPELMNRQRHA